MSEETAKKKLDFDFSDISGKTTQVQSVEAVNNVLGSQDVKPTEAPKKEEKPQPKAAISELSGINLAVPRNGKWLLKDLAECTAEEFLAWAKFCHPEVTCSSERFESRTNRIRAYNQIKSYWESSMGKKQRDASN